jgi:o-succinylbenzoate---CoA ligase
MATDDRRLVAVQLPPPAFSEGLRAVWQAGNAALPLRADAPRPAAVEILKALHPDAILDERGERPLPDGTGVPEGTALVVATSGTTGTPKGVVLSHRALRASADITLRRLGLEHGARWICCLPTHHIAGLNVFVRAWRCGTQPILVPDFSVEAVAEALPADAISLVPTMLARLLDAGVDLSGFQAVLIGGAPLSPSLADRAKAAGAPITVSYGMTETCGGCVYDGSPLDDVAIRIEDDGRIAVRGPILFDGYRGADAGPGPQPDGWFVTNDLGRLDDGRLEVLGRADHVIITGGENVVPEEAERVLCEHPAIADAAVVGRPDPEWGEAVVAIVVPAGEAPSVDELRAFVKSCAEKALAPRALAVVDGLPRLDSGKLDREALRRTYGAARPG